MSNDPFIGKELAGKYRIDGFLKRGGMGAVYRARHLMLDKAIAIKVINPEFVTTNDVVERFQREARAAASLDHPNIVTIHDLAQTSEGVLYIAMELVSGESLKELIKKEGPLDTGRTLSLVSGITSALTLAHQKKVVHRDLKPQNIMICPASGGGETAKLLDFGIAKIFESDKTQLTSTGMVIGTPHYMSPEQANGSEVDARSDLYSLGIILYEMLVGKVPFDDRSTPAVLVKHLSELPKPPSEFRKGLPQQLEKTVLRCLEKDPAKRFQTAAELAAALAAVDQGESAAPIATAIPAPSPPQTLPTAAGKSGATTQGAGPDTAGVPQDPLETEVVSSSGVEPGAGRESGGHSRQASIHPPGPPAAPPPPLPKASTGPTAPIQGRPRPAPPHSRKGGGVLLALGLGALVLLLAAAVGITLALRGGGKEAPEAAEGPNQEAPQGTPASAVTTPTSDPMSGASVPGPEPTPESPVSTSEPPAEVVSPSPPLKTAVPVVATKDPSPAPAPATPPQRPPAVEPAVAPPLPVHPSVHIACEGLSDACASFRAALTKEIQSRGMPPAARGRAELVVSARAEEIESRSETNFGTTFVIRTYSIEVAGEALPFDEDVMMPGPEVFSFDTRFGREKLNERCRVLAGQVASALADYWSARRSSP